MKKLFFSLCIAIAITGIAKANIVRSIIIEKKTSKCKLLTKNIVSTTIPFTIEHGWIVIEAEVSNNNSRPKKEKFLLDTGNSTSFTIEYAKADALAQRPIRTKSTAFADKARNETDAFAKYATTLKIGDMQVQENHIFISKVGITSVECIGAKGIIGSNLLSKFIVTIDFSNNMLTLSNKELFNYEAMGIYNQKISFLATPMQKIPSPYIKVNDKDIFTIWDTGFTGDMTLQYKNSSRIAGIISDTQTIAYETYGAFVNTNGVVKKNIMLYSWENATFKSEKSKDTFLIHGGIVYCDNDVRENNLNLGLKFMRQYDKIVIDWRKNNIYLFNPKPLSPYTPESNFALRYLPDEKRYVAGMVNIKAPLYAKGLRGGDEIISINGKMLSEIDMTNKCASQDGIQQLTKDAKIVIVKRADKQITIVL